MKQIVTVDRISRKEFFHDFVKTAKPVLIKNQTGDWPARKLWNAEYFKNPQWNIKIATKTGDVSQGKRESIYLSDYVEGLINYEHALAAGRHPERPAYLHDVPIFNLLPELIKDIEPFPLELFPKWYWHNWQNYIQFFMGSTNSITPLHFDTLCTHNMFFQMIGSKRFILVKPEQKDLCYIKGWRWAQIDVDNPDYTRFPDTRSLDPQEVIVEAGDILYMPPGMLHQVNGLSYSVSFNIDWHTPKSAASGVFSKFTGAPWQNMYYNFLVFMGLALKVPSKFIFPYYKSYLNYVS